MMLCQISEYPAKCNSSEFIRCSRYLNLIVNEPVFISGNIICEKKQSPMKITFSRETGQPMYTTWRRDKHGDMASFFSYSGSWRVSF